MAGIDVTGNFADEAIVLPNDVLVKDIFQRLRSAEKDKTDINSRCPLSPIPIAEVQDCTMSSQDNRRRHPSLQRSLSHETTLKRRKRNDVRMSLNERSLCDEWATYTPEEREILKIVILKADSEEQCACDGLSRSRKKSKKNLRINKPKLFSRNQNSGQQPRSSSVGLNSEKDKNNDGKVLSKIPNFIRRFMDGTSQKLHSVSPKLNQRRQSGLERKSSSAGANGERKAGGRRPVGNSMVHAMLKEEIERSSSNCCLSASNCSVVEEVEKARLEYSNQLERIPRRASDANSKKHCNQRVNLFRANSARVARPNRPEETETFFEIFDKFRNDPMTLADDTELLY